MSSVNLKEPRNILRMEYSGKPLEISVYDYDCNIRYRCVSIEQMFSLSEIRKHEEWNNIAPNRVCDVPLTKEKDEDDKSEVTPCANDKKVLESKNKMKRNNRRKNKKRNNSNKNYGNGEVAQGSDHPRPKPMNKAEFTIRGYRMSWFGFMDPSPSLIAQRLHSALIFARCFFSLHLKNIKRFMQVECRMPSE